jgi:hypothetical protein
MQPRSGRWLHPQAEEMRARENRLFDVKGVQMLGDHFCGRTSRFLSRVAHRVAPQHSNGTRQMRPG